MKEGKYKCRDFGKSMIYRQRLKLPMSRTNFHGPKDVRAIEVRLYISLIFDKNRSN